MFDFLKKRAQSEAELKALADGEMIPLSDVKDEMFSQKMMGDGVAFRLENGRITAPCSGILSAVFPGGHAYGITRSDGVEILIHIGIDTVSLNGETVGVGFGSSKKRAEQMAARDAMEKLFPNSVQ